LNSKKVILGINWEQNSTVSLMIDGRIVACISEERFSRVKNDERYPVNAINWILKEFNISPEDISLVAFISKSWSPTYSLVRHYTTFDINDYILEQKNIWFPRIFKKKKISHLKVFKKKIDYTQFPGISFWRKNLSKYMSLVDHASNKKILKIGQEIRVDVICRHLNIEKKKIIFIDHSTGHAFYSFFASPNKKGNNLVITLDAFGDHINYSAYNFFKNKKNINIKLIANGGNFIIGRLYRYITLILGLKPNEHEYKVMGLAPYCKEIYYREILNLFKKFQIVKNNKFFDKQKPKDLYFSIKKILDGKRFDAIAGALQNYTEQLILKWINNFVKKYYFKNIYYAGGVAMNVKANLLISNIKGVKNLYVPPSPDDSSQAMGACYVAYYQTYKKTPRKLNNAYLGFNIKSNKIKNSFFKNKSNFNYKIITKNINFYAAKMLSEGKILARAVGRSEFGARSLGNRSILASPRDINVKHRINEKIKNRDFWMPFAASVLSSHAKKYFRINSDFSCYSYMTNCLETTSLGKKDLISAIHPYDFTCRPQILKKNDNPQYEDLIKKFGLITGVYALLNTSFNLHGHPLVNDEKDAFNVFKKTELDGLIFEKCLIAKI
jgi:carbamoyltransferase